MCSICVVPTASNGTTAFAAGVVVAGVANAPPAAKAVSGGGGDSAEAGGAVAMAAADGPCEADCAAAAPLDRESLVSSEKRRGLHACGCCAPSTRKRPRVTRVPMRSSAGMPPTSRRWWVEGTWGGVERLDDGTADEAAPSTLPTIKRRRAGPDAPTEPATCGGGAVCCCVEGAAAAAVAAVAAPLAVRVPAAAAHAVDEQPPAPATDMLWIELLLLPRLSAAAAGISRLKSERTAADLPCTGLPGALGLSGCELSSERFELSAPMLSARLPWLLLRLSWRLAAAAAALPGPPAAAAAATCWRSCCLSRCLRSKNSRRNPPYVSGPAIAPASGIFGYGFRPSRGAERVRVSFRGCALAAPPGSIGARSGIKRVSWARSHTAQLRSSLSTTCDTRGVWGGRVSAEPASHDRESQHACSGLWVASPRRGWQQRHRRQRCPPDYLRVAEICRCATPRRIPPQRVHPFSLLYSEGRAAQSSRSMSTRLQTAAPRGTPRHGRR